LKFNAIIDSSKTKYLLVYKQPPNYPKYEIVTGIISFQNQVLDANQYIQVNNSIDDTINISFYTPFTTIFPVNQQFQFDINLEPNRNKNLLLNNNLYPTGFEIYGYFYWISDYVHTSTQYYCTDVTSQQISYTTPSYCKSGSGTYTYNDKNFPSEVNSIFVFSGYSNADLAFSNSQNNYNNAYSYLNSKGLLPDNGLIGLCFGGGNENGGWNTGENGAIYSLYRACTKKGVAFNYTETGSGGSGDQSKMGKNLTGIGTGLITNIYNSLLFDIETWTSPSGSTGEDFINLFNYIKLNPNSTFYSYKCIIIASIAHSCSNYNGTGQSVISTLISDSTGSYDYLNNHTQNVGSTNEYCANYNILWTGASNCFVDYLKRNAKYGNYFILPAINLPNLYTGPGTNISRNPNLYFYQSTTNNNDPVTESPSGYVTIPYTVDNGITGFFQSITNSNQSLGGYIQWVNGTLITNHN
jgi:hypothetical protein